jgi:hypothetical protein
MASTQSISPLLQASVSDQLYGYALSSAFRRSTVYDPSYALAKEPDIWEIVRSDVGFSASIDRYTNQVTKPWHVEAAKKSKDEKDQQYAEIVSDAIGQIYDFDNARRIMSEAAFLGRRYSFIESERRMISLGGEKEMEWIVPTLLKDIDRRRFRWVPELVGEPGNQKRVTKLSFFNTITAQWQEVSPQFRQALIEFIWYNTEDRVGYGRGWLESIYFAHFMKTNTVMKIADGVDRWAKGIWLGKLDGLRNASTDTTNTDLVEGMKSMLRSMRNDNIGIIENTDDIQVIETTGTGHQISMEFVGYWDNSVERLVNGSTRPTGLGGQKTGAKAQAETEEDTSEAHYQPARDTGDAVINRDLIGWFISQPLNRQNFKALGLLDAKRPVFHSRQEKKEAIADILASATMFMQNGLPLVEQEVYERAGGWSVPGPDDKVVSGKALMGPTDMVGDFGNAEEINANASQNVQADRAAKNKPKPKAKMSEDGDISARFDNLERMITTRSGSGNVTVNLPESLSAKIQQPDIHITTPEPKVVIQAAERMPAPIVNASFTAPIIPPATVNVTPVVRFEDHKSASALERIGGLLEKVISVFSLGRGKKTTVVKKRDAQGNISEFETKED